MFEKLHTYLGEEIDNVQLVFFRMCFGFLVAAEGFGAVATGWVAKVFVKPEFHFTFIPFSWLQPLPGDGMIYFYYGIGIIGIFIMLGLFYRVSSLVFFFMWTFTYVMQKDHYNNHYYLMVLLAAAMALFPAHKSHSLDVKFGITQPAQTCYRFHIKFFVVQVVIVYLFASWHKVYPDWLEGEPIKSWFTAKAGYPIIGPLLAQEWFQYAVAYGGIFFDGTIAFMLLNKRTRNYGFYLSLFFHLFNSAVFQIGIFPYLMIAITAFFYTPEDVKRRFKFLSGNRQVVLTRSYPKALTVLFAIYFLIQVYLPLRHFHFKGDVLYTEEGHRMAWRMMLRKKTGFLKYKVVDKSTGEVMWNKAENLKVSQRRDAACKPDMCWQYAQFLKESYAAVGKDVSIYAYAKAKVNDVPYYRIIDPEVDLASVPWDYFTHSDWILSPDFE